MCQQKLATMKQLCEALVESSATICRDLDYMRDRLGVPVVWHAANLGYVLSGLEPMGQAQELLGL